MKKSVILAALVLGGGFTAGSALVAGASGTLQAPGPAGGPNVIGPVTPGLFDGDLAALPTVPTGVEVPPGQEGRVVPRQRPEFVPPPRPTAAFVDPVRQLQPLGTDAVPGLLLDFEGMGPMGASPPDTVGDVGPDHYIQMVNLAFTIYDRSGNALAGPLDVNSLWTGFGGACENENAGDPIVLYDSLADRWLISQFGFFGGATENECIAISATPDPLGSWHLYDFPFTEFPDYPKLAVWRDAYYMGSNQFATSDMGFSAFDRDAMLAGDPAIAIQFTSPATGPHSLPLPCDVDGPVPPPPGSPGIFWRHVDGAVDGVDRIELYELAPDFVNPSSSTLDGPESLPVAPFASLCNFSTDCIVQPDTAQRLDSITEWPMHRCAYRNFGDHQAMVGNHSVNVGGDQSGIRWYELRDTGSGWSIHQQGTHAPDTDSRWMGSIAMDARGNIALGYSVSSSSTFPGIRYTGRLVGDAPGTMRREKVLIDGGGSQTTLNRWGDYSAMSVDPRDGCTFWYTNEYHDTTASGFSWNTRVGTFRFDDACGPLFFPGDDDEDEEAEEQQAAR